MKTTLKKSQIRPKAKVQKKVNKTKVKEAGVKVEKVNGMEVREVIKPIPGIYKIRSIACDLVEFFNKKIDEQKKDVYVSQDELLTSMMKIGYSRSYIYLKIKELSQGKIKVGYDVKETNPDIYEPLLIKKHRDLFDGVIGWVYKLNDKWKTISLEEIKYVFNGE